MQSDVIYYLHYKIINLRDTKPSRDDLFKKHFSYTLQLYSNECPKAKSEENAGN
jgi:hypothetical protein